MKRLFIFLLAMVVLFIFSHSIFADMIVAWGNDEYGVVSNAPLSNDYTPVVAVDSSKDGSLASRFVSWYMPKLQRLEVFFKKWGALLFVGLTGTIVVIMLIRSLITGNWSFWHDVWERGGGT